MIWLIAVCDQTLSKFLCFLSRAAAAALDRSTSIIRSSTSPCRRCLVFSREEHLELTASTASSASWRRSAKRFLCRNTVRLSSEAAEPKFWDAVLLGLLQLLSPLDGVALVLAPPLGNLAVGLGQAAVQLSFGLLLLLVLLPQQLAVVTRRQQTVSQGVLRLRTQRQTLVQRHGAKSQCFSNCWPLPPSGRQGTACKGESVCGSISSKCNATASLPKDWA